MPDNQPKEKLMDLATLQTWWTPKDAAKVLGVTRQRVGQLIRRDKLKAVRVADTYLIDPESCRARKEMLAEAGS